MKKTVAIFLALTMSLVSCSISAFAESKDPGFTEETSSEQTSETVHEITRAEFPLYSNMEDSGVAIPLFFLDGVKDLPYVDADGLKFLLEGLLDFKCTMSTDGSAVTFNRFNDLFEVDIPMTIDFDKNVIFFADYDLFTMNANSSGIMDTTRLTGFNADGEPSILQKVDNGSLAR